MSKLIVATWEKTIPAAEYDEETDTFSEVCDFDDEATDASWTEIEFDDLQSAIEWLWKEGYTTRWESETLIDDFEEFEQLMFDCWYYPSPSGRCHMPIVQRGVDYYMNPRTGVSTLDQACIQGYREEEKQDEA